MDRAEGEAIFDSGRECCVGFILELVASVERLTATGELLEERVRRLELETRRDSRTSSKPPSQDPPKSRQQRRAEARLKAKELLAQRGEVKRDAGAQQGHLGVGREHAPEDQVDEIVSHYPEACRGCGREFSERERRPFGRFGAHQVVDLSADQRDHGRASDTQVALSGVQDHNDREASSRDRWHGVRCEVALGDRDVECA